MAVVDFQNWGTRITPLLLDGGTLTAPCEIMGSDPCNENFSAGPTAWWKAAVVDDALGGAPCVLLRSGHFRVWAPGKAWDEAVALGHPHKV